MSVAISEPTVDPRQALQPLWHRSTSKQIVDKCRGSDPSAGWSVWQRHLARRKRPQVPPFLSGKQIPLLWGWDRISDFGFRLADLCVEPVAQNGPAASKAGGVEVALEQLARAYALPELAGRLSAESWWDAVAQLHELAQDAQQIRVDLQSDPEEAVRQQLLAGELPLVLGYLFPELRALRALRKPARGTLSQGLLEWTDGQGLPHARLLSVLGPLWACWTRARWMGERLKRGCWSRDAEIQYQWLVRNAIRLTDPSGRLSFSSSDETSADGPDGNERGWPKGLYATALELVGDASDYAAAAGTLPRGVIARRGRATIDADDLPEASLNSEWSGITVMASDWSQTAVRATAAWVDDTIRFELAAGRERLFDGEVISRTTCDGEAVTFVDEWEQVCWQSDEQGDYLELSIDLSHGLRLERQLLLNRADRVVYLADVVLSSDKSPRRIVHAIELPMGPEAVWQPEAETRDGVVDGIKARAAVLPLALAEWRSDPRGGRLEAAPGKLVLTQETSGRALCCPVLLDLDQRRTKKERTWRQLTVAEMLETVPNDRAVGYRAQSGRRQWLFYRSLGPVGNRTLIGQNIAGEFYAGRLLSSGMLEEWVEIDSGENVENDE